MVSGDKPVYARISNAESRLPMKRFSGKKGHSRGILEALLDRVRGREQLLVRAGDDRPLLLISFPRGARAAAEELERAWAHALRRLSARTLAPYSNVFEKLPAIVVVLLNPFNPCECLGHHHPHGAESRLTRRLEADLGEDIGEIDLAYEGIRAWRPTPLSTLAADALGLRVEAIHFQAALLAVLLHELEHLVFPNESEHDIRLRSNAFYAAAMEELVREESGAGYGMASPPRP
jgi:hypothetical protein